MKIKPEQPDVAAAVSYFVDMAKGKTAPTRQTIQTGLGAVHQPTVFRVIPKIELVTPTAQALVRAREKVIRGEVQQNKRKADELSSSDKPKKKKKTKKGKSTDQYLMPGLD